MFVFSSTSHLPWFWHLAVGDDFCLCFVSRVATGLVVSSFVSNPTAGQGRLYIIYRLTCTTEHPLVDKYDLSSLKVLHSGAAPLTRELTEAVWNRLKIPVKQGFGLSETSPVTHCQRMYEWAKYMGSIGKLFPNMEARIVDEDGKDVPDGEVGFFSSFYPLVTFRLEIGK